MTDIDDYKNCGSRLEFAKQMTFYERNAYIKVYTSMVRGKEDFNAQIVVMSVDTDEPDIAIGRTVVLIFCGEFTLNGQRYVEGVVRVNMLGYVSVVGKLSGDDLFSGQQYDDLGLRHAWEALGSFSPNPDGDGIVFASFPTLDYGQVQR